VCSVIPVGAIDQPCPKNRTDVGHQTGRPVWASEVIDLITDTLPAGDIVRNMAADAEAALRRILS
jgi:hypothetical protein